MKKLTILLAAVFLFNTLPVFAEGTSENTAELLPEAEVGEINDAAIISAEVTAEEISAEESAEAPAEVPAVITDIPLTIDGTRITGTAIMKSGVMMVPFRETTKAFRLSYSYSNGNYAALAPRRSFKVDSLMNAYILDVLQIPEITPELIDDTLYVPASLFVKAFNLDMIVLEQGEKPELYLASSAVDDTELNNAFVNTTGLASDTPYLVWISKSEFKVRVFLGEKGHWTQVKDFTCGIGAPGTPTCEGTYKYYQAQPMWDYGSYYVGPIMRFNGGYAIHSTLIYKNGTPKDNRVGIRLSLGCIRLRPDDIHWMAYYVPLGTTIHITG